MKVTQIRKADLTRTAVIGCPGSGKTTFAKNLGKVLHREVIHLDNRLWSENWQMNPNREQIHSDIISADNWLIDGMWGSLLEQRFARATTVVFLDYPTWLCLYRAERRRKLYKGVQRDDMAQGCVEKERDEEFVKCIRTFRRRVRPLIFDLHKSYPDVNFVVVSNPLQANRILKKLSK